MTSRQAVHRRVGGDPETGRDAGGKETFVSPASPSSPSGGDRASPLNSASAVSPAGHAPSSALAPSLPYSNSASHPRGGAVHTAWRTVVGTGSGAKKAMRLAGVLLLLLIIINWGWVMHMYDRLHNIHRMHDCGCGADGPLCPYHSWSLFGMDTPPCIRRRLYDIVDVIKEVVEAQGGTYFVTSGTMLAALREGRAIPWEVDVDIAIAGVNGQEFCKALPPRFKCESRNKPYPLEEYYVMDTEAPSFSRMEYIQADVFVVQPGDYVPETGRCMYGDSGAILCPKDWEDRLIKKKAAIGEEGYQNGGCDLLMPWNDYCIMNCRRDLDFRPMKKLHEEGYMSLWPLALKCKDFLADRGIALPTDS